MLISIRHVTRYAYAEPVGYAIQSLRLTPLSFNGQRVLDWQVHMPGFGPVLQFKDGFGNIVQVTTINTPHQEVVIEASGTVETTDCSGVVAGLPNTSPCRVFLRETTQTKPDAAIRDLAASAKGQDLLDTLHTLAGIVCDRVDYVLGSTDAHTGAAEALADGKGVCQDHAHIFISAARSLGVPTRYVTGYLVLGEQSRSEAHHAWTEAWVEGLGWVAFDVANRICPTERYVRLAVGLDAGGAAPVVGSRRGGQHELLDVSVDVREQNAQQ
jgi:transglutaminase-like putative cysteine protease